ncbi:MAG: hypothetical protein ACLQEQ_01615 [Nitrososphaerales archaeon]
MRRRWVFSIILVVLIVIGIAYYLAFLIPLPSKELSWGIPWIAQAGEGSYKESIPTGYFPINQSEATEYAKSFIKDYDGFVDSYQASLTTTTLKRFFPLYGSFEVYVARENYSATDDRIEFLFIYNQSVTSLKITVLTNETAQYLRPVLVSGLDLPTNTSYAEYGSTLGFYIGDLTTESPLGINHINAVWITNSSLVYNDILINSNAAAHSLYDANTQDYTYTTGPPQLLSPRWFESAFWDPVLWVVVLVVGAVGQYFGSWEEAIKVMESERERKHFVKKWRKRLRAVKKFIVRGKEPQKVKEEDDEKKNEE